MSPCAGSGAKFGNGVLWFCVLKKFAWPINASSNVVPPVWVRRLAKPSNENSADAFVISFSLSSVFWRS